MDTEKIPGQGSTYESFFLAMQENNTIGNFLRFKNKPIMNRGLGTADLKEHPHHELCRRLVASGASLGLRDQQSKVLVGVSLNEILKRGGEQDMFDPEKETDPNVRKLNFIMSQLMGSYNLFSDPNVTLVLDLVILCTNPSFARRGIATELVQLSEKKAAELNCQMITAQATSCYSQRIFNKLGYTVQSSLDYKGFLLDGQPVLDITKMEPHTCAQVVTKFLL
ncbi:unnamed protein product, partial [Meganyctiphanes norvegica]